MPKAKLLVIDDNPFICKLMASRLTANDYAVIIALGGAEGLKKAAEEKPDLILLDFTMPDMDGVEVGTKLKGNDATRNIPIIMVTARSEHAIVVKAMENFNPAAYVVKPFNPDNITICKLLASRLSANNFTVVIALSGPEGLKKAAEESPDIILLDITMPDMDGVEVGMKLRKDPSTKNSPIIMLTAHGERTIINLTEERFKPEGYIIKPFNPEKLLEEIDRVLTEKK